MEINWEGLRRTPRNYVASDLIISEGGAAVKYSVYLRNDIQLIFQSADRSRVEHAARLLRRLNVGAEVKKVGGVWYVCAYTDVLAAGRGELRKALAEVVRETAARGWVDRGRAERWLKKLERGRALRKGWPKYLIRLSRRGTLAVTFGSTNPHSIWREAQRLREMGLGEGVHFSVKMPEEGRDGYVYIRREGLSYAAWLSVRGNGGQQRLAAEFVEYILQRAREEGEEVYEKVREIVEEGRARGSLTLKGFEMVVETGGRRRVVRVIDGDARLDEGRDGRRLLRIKIAAEVDGVSGEYEIVFGRYGRKNETAGYATARADAPGGREEDAKRLAAVVETLTGMKPRVHRKKNGAVVVVCGRRHLEGFRRFVELADAIERWLNGR
jgi:hypothetical protein